ncbi:hypothetical protein EDB80DRAFT_874840 [Ilyonectria destructans]|nr:hypothetical protein EDB80DRAFT_874840 [Ilyonectria destructans]
MLAALRSVARSRDAAEASMEPRSPQPQEGHPSPPGSLLVAETEKKRTRSVDEMNKMLDEMLQDRVDPGQVVQIERGSIRWQVGGNWIPRQHKFTTEPLRQSPTPGLDARAGGGD